MIDTKKEQERDELHRAIWAIADELRGAVDGWDFKNYVLGTMFYRYISENLCSYINSGEFEAGNTDFDFAKISDEDAEEAKDGLVEEKGFFILPSELFSNVRANAVNDKNLNETLERVFRHIEESAKGSEAENDFAGLFDDFDVNSNKLGSTVAKRNEKLVKLLNGVALMNLGDVKDHSIDAFGDAYEYLMSMYASNAGKSGGEFYTPADVSELLTRLGTVGKTEINKVYDPACGSGSLLLKVETVLGKEAVRNGYYGQEINITTYNLCRINMFLHDIRFDKFNVACEDTLIAPQHWDEEPFELIVSNPPYSIKWAGDENPLLINDPRFAPAGVLAPKSKADLAFIMHSLSWLASNAGKSGGEFYTPADVSELLTRLGTVGKTEINKVYDPACGSGSLLLKVETVLGKEAVRNGYYGQEINITTYNLCRINMFLHDIGFDKFNVACEDTLMSPQHWDDEPFELIVSNPPYSIKWAGDENPLLINDPRFAPAGVLAPKSKADMAFIMHSLSWLASNGTAAIVCFPGIMYRGGAEQKIRKYLVDNNFVDCIIQLPSNLFFGTSIATCIMVMKKNKNDNQTLFIDASSECIKVTNNNKLTPANIERIVDIFANREEVKHFSHSASYDEVVENDYNLSVSTYVEAEDTREKIDIVKLNTEIEQIVAREAVLRDEIATIIAEIEG